MTEAVGATDTEDPKDQRPVSPSWRTVGVSVRGSGHIKSQTPCQDAHVILDDVNISSIEASGGEAVSLSVVAVADGAGSARFSQEGAELATTVAARTLKERLQACVGDWFVALPPLLEESVEDARSAVETLASERDLDLREFGSTLILLVAGPDRVAGVHIGDGGVVVSLSRSHDICETISFPQNGEFINETTFLTSSDFRSQIRHFARAGVRFYGLAAFSDGIEFVCLKMPSGEASPGFFAPIFRFVETTPDSAAVRHDVASFLESERVCARTDDDKTLVVGVLRTEAMLPAAAGAEG